jgi:hypothetical protein
MFARNHETIDGSMIVRKDPTIWCDLYRCMHLGYKRIVQHHVGVDASAYRDCASALVQR